MERSCARLHAELRPRLCCWRSSSIVRSQVSGPPPCLSPLGHLCPHSIRSILSETRSQTSAVSDFFICRLPKFHWIYLVGDQVRDFFICRKLVCDQVPDFFVENLSPHRLVCDQVPDFFICRKLVARSISTCRDRSILSTFLVPDLSATCRRPAQNMSETWF